MPHAEQHYHWTWTLASPPEALWPLVSNTDRFNRDCGYPAVTALAPDEKQLATAITNRRRLQTSVMGVVIQWEEEAFEWIAPRRFGVVRTYQRGPLARMVVNCELEPRDGGTVLHYDMRVTPSGWLGRIAVPFSIGRRAGTTMGRVFHRYDEHARRRLTRSALTQRPRLTDGATARVASTAQTLVEREGQSPDLVRRLSDLITTADDLTVARIRPYAVADEWAANRRDTLHLFLHGTRAGLLDFSWDLVCPHCRGPKAGAGTLADLRGEAHCDSCHVDFTANFDQSVELTFRPNAAIRSVPRAYYCVGGPQVTPHIAAQQTIPAGAAREFEVSAEPGRYRVRSPGVEPQAPFRITVDGPRTLRLELGQPSNEDVAVAQGGSLLLSNPTDQPRLVIVERIAWTDQATTAAEVTSLQLFRDLFSREVLRRGEQISAGAMTIVFTDLKNSTELYQQIGDAPAFGRVLTHFEVLKAAVAEDGGAIVKTMGDAIMATFPRPLSAVSAMLRAKRWLANPATFTPPAGVEFPASSLQPLALKAGIHTGPCLAINQNDRLDYFGTTVNAAARLCGQCTGSDIVLSAAAAADPEVAAFLTSAHAPANHPESVRLKGFGDAAFAICRITPEPHG